MLKTLPKPLTLSSLPRVVEHWDLFICYRRADGSDAARSVYELLNNRRLGFTAPGQKGEMRVRAFIDEEMPGASNWVELRLNALMLCRTFVMICTPGARAVLSRRDHVQDEIRWWLKNREQAPILIVAADRDMRWIPRRLARAFPDANCIPLHESTDDLTSAQNEFVRSVLRGIHENANEVLRR